MKEYKLTNIIDLIIDRRGVTPKKLKSNWCNSGIPVISAKNVKSGNIINDKDIKFISEDTYNLWMKESLRIGDVVMTSEAPLGELYLMKSNASVALGQRLYGIRFNNNIVDSTFMYYYMSTSLYQKELSGKSSGTTVFGIRQSELLETKLNLPDLPTQKKIADLLSSLDDKIETNNKINQELEELGQALYTKWFVNFDFPNEEGKPYKSSGGEMIESELGMIPKGWKVGNISDVFDFEKGVEPGSSNYTNNKDDIRFIRVGDMQSTSPEIYVSKDIMEAKKLKYISNKDITISLDGTIGKVFVGNEGCISSGIRVIRLKGYEDMIDYTYLFAKSKYLINSLTGGSSGSIIKHAGGILNDLKIVHPDTVTLLKFQDLYSGIVETIIQNRMENKKLEELRDFLIPQLMSGNLEIKDIDNTEKEV